MNVSIFPLKIYIALFFACCVVLLFPHILFAAENVTSSTVGNATLYTFKTTSCTPRILTQDVGIVIPNTIAYGNKTYIYFHGNDDPRPTLEQYCNGSVYKICEAATALESPIIFPLVNVKGSSQQTRITKAEFECMINEARSVMTANNVTLPAQYIVAGHSAGAFTMSSYFIAGLTAHRATILDGCYTAVDKDNKNLNFCQDTINAFTTGIVYIYYQVGSQETKANSIQAKNQAPTQVRLAEVNLSHTALATACLKDVLECGGKTISVQEPSSSTGNTEAVTGSTGNTGAGTGVAGSSATNNNTAYSGLNSERVELANPIGQTDISIIIGIVIRNLLAIIGGVALLAFVVGGAYWLISAGNAENVKKGTQTMLWASIGLAVVFSSYGLLSTVITGLTGGGGGTSSAAPGAVVAQYYIVVSSQTTPILTDALSPRDTTTLRTDVTCVEGTGKTKEGYIGVRVGTISGPLEGWVRATDLRPMTPSEVTAKKCGT